jgi:hypothetical protein
MACQPSLITLPIELQQQIFHDALGAGQVTVEISEHGHLLTKLCPLLRVCATLRLNVLECCRHDQLHLVYAFTSPESLSSQYAIIKTVVGAPLHSIRLRLLPDLPVEPSVWDIPFFERILDSWQEAFASLPKSIPTRRVYVDITNTQIIPRVPLAAVLHSITYAIHQKSGGQATSRLEKHSTASPAVGAISSGENASYKRSRLDDIMERLRDSRWGNKGSRRIGGSTTPVRKPNLK